jgi:NAD(P)-dependent dehydrogenase (short-subunit alcohol dehydrogenase family)
MGKLNNKIVLVTGGNSGIGRSSAELALEEGALHVVVTDLHHKLISDFKEESKKNVSYFQLDVSLETSWKSLVEKLSSRFGKIDILINNAGIVGTKLDDPSLSIQSSTLDNWRKVHQINLDGIYLASKYCLPLLSNSNSGAIVNVGSRSGKIGRPNRIAYGSSKSAIISLTKSLAMYFCEEGLKIRCNAIVPSTILTPAWDPLLQKEGTIHEDISKRIPLGRFGMPIEVARAIVFLASEEASYITGTELVVDGGVSAKDFLRV